jgi:type VI protein secretion system component Hcp
MKFEVVDQSTVTFVSRKNRKSKYDDIFVSLKSLVKGKSLIIKVEGDKSVEKLRQNIFQALRNHDLDTFKVGVLEDQSGVAISKKEVSNA